MRIFAFVTVLLVSSAALGQSVTGVSGTVSDGSSITIIGSGFGTKPTAAPYLWDNFEGGANGALVGSGTHGLFTEPGIAEYSNSDSYSGDMCSYSFKSGTVSSDNPGHHASMAPSEFTEGFISMKWKIVSASGDLSPQNIKLLRFNSDDPDASHGFPNYNMGADRGSTSFSGIVNHGSSLQDYVCSIGTNYNYGQWNSLSMWAACGDVEVSNGLAGSCSNGLVCEEAGILTLTETIPVTSFVHNGYRQFYWCGYIDSITGTTDTYLYLDDLYADTTLARVIIAENSSWSNLGNYEMQIPSAWSASSITVTVNQGTFAAEDAAYLFVVDADGSVSDGYAVTIGGTASASLTAPSNLRQHKGN